MKFYQFATTLALSSLATLSHAAPIWQDFNLAALYGKNYALPDNMRHDNNQTTITAEYTAKLKYGDFFGFVDRTENDFSKDTYFEASPRLSLGAITGKKLELGPIKDVLIAGTWEGGNNFNNYLYGIGFDVEIPYFQYAQFNFYKAKNDLIKDDYQLTFVYGIPFKISNEEFLIDGFLDWSTSTSDSRSELNWTGQWKWNLGQHIAPDTRLYLGVEYSRWHNKYGIPGLNQNDVSALIKYHF
ncbi:ion channel protein Tsx [Acinetobacter sp. ANC 4558]|uniref:outer membrane protein OmpK n=1 Tax=Acinetobacter sp. ANC 4558 TaxID=1977876 RepID=UPI000A3518C7|nr:outer membrane protein OmpK [Acinetobacter sp. ANC 4558]OTG88202.1 ion channel protein Tsx [Acinetobacter sp. ANC 4558]